MGRWELNHLETKILEAAQATRYPPEAGQEENEKGHGCLKYIQVQYCQQEGQKRLLWSCLLLKEFSPAQSSAKAKRGTPVELLLSKDNWSKDDFSGEDEDDKIRPGKEIAGDELGLHRGASTRVDHQGHRHQVGLLERLLDHCLCLLQVERLLPANLALQDDDRHSRFLQTGWNTAHGVTSTKLWLANIFLLCSFGFVQIPTSISQI